MPTESDGRTAGGRDPLALDALALDAETMRELGYRTVDRVIEWMAAGRPGLARMTREETEAALHGPPPDRPLPPGEVLDRLGSALSMIARSDHPGFFAFIPGEPTWPGALADFAASAVNAHATDWIEAPGPTQVELTVLDWMRQWIGYGLEAGGVFGSGGSAANMTAIACAREALVGPMRDDLVLYLTDQAHSSIARAARILGFRPDQVRVLTVDEHYRMRPEALALAMDADLRAGRRPLFVAAAAGSTNTGSIDPLPEIAAVCRERGAWFHVDGAYGGGALLSERGRAWLRGIEEADSVTLDPHKWMYQPFECGALLVREMANLQRAFEISPDYLKDIETALREPNFADLGMQLTRGARALKVWVSIQYFGLDAFRSAVDRSIDLAEHARARIEASPTLKLVAPPSLGVLCFRRVVPGAPEEVQEAVNAQLVPKVAAGGEAFISSTRLRGRYALRMVILNHSTGREHVDALLDFLESEPVDATAAAPAAEADHDYAYGRGSGAGFVRSSRFEGVNLAAIPLFEGLTPDELEQVERVSYERFVAAGEPLIAQWDNSRELLVLLEGSARVVAADGRVLREVPAGDFVGEIAALEWHAGFTYTRTATVVATTPVRLLVIPEGTVPVLARDLPLVGDRLRAALKAHLPTV